MKIDIHALKEGSNPVEYEIPAEGFDRILKEVDALYHATGKPCSVEVDVQKYFDTIQLKGRVTGPIGFECARCLRENDVPILIRLNWTLLPREKFLGDDVSDEEGRELTADDLDVSFYEGDEIDLSELVREAVLLELAPVPRCDVDKCRGDEYLRALSDGDESPAIDPRWAPLLAAKTSKRLKN
jgi:uncharacterized protein